MGILGQQQGSPHLEIDLGAQPAPGDLTREEKPSPCSCLPPLRPGLSNGRTAGKLEARLRPAAVGSAQGLRRRVESGCGGRASHTHSAPGAGGGNTNVTESRDLRDWIWGVRKFSGLSDEWLLGASAKEMG